MKSLNLVISDEAVSDLTEIWTHIAEDSPARADQFIDQIYDKRVRLTRDSASHKIPF